MTNSHHADPIRYWDSCAFLAYFNEEEEKDECEQVLAACSEGKAQIVTSALTLAEVLKAKGKKPLPMERSEQITSFFEHSYIVVRTVTRRTAEFARQIIWEYSIDPKDAIHVATALHANIDLLETKDRKLLRKSPLKVSGYQSLDMEKPWWAVPIIPGTQPPTEAETP